MEYVTNAFDTNWVAPSGPHLEEFEKLLAKYTKSENVAALSSGTAALHLSLIMLGIESGDEVICSTFTFSASANPISYLGATPVFIDSEDKTWNMSPELLEKAIIDRISSGKRPKAIILVHIYGMPAQIDKIMSIAEKYQIPVVEDAAEAVGSKFNNMALGTFGIIGVFSFNGNKIITTSGGGALLSDNRELVENARYLSTQARSDAPHYQHYQLGYNYRLSNICAAIGCGQMEVLDDRVSRRREIFNIYKNRLSNIEGISFLEEPNKSYYSNYWLTTVLIDPKITDGVTRETIRLALKSDDIEARPLWKPMHMQPIFSTVPAYLDGNSEKLFENGLCLPSGSNMTDDDVDRIINIIKNQFCL